MSHLRVSVFALVLAAAGLPLYIHLPRYANVDLGLDLATVGVIVLAIRIFDFVSDPFIGFVIDRWHRYKIFFAVLSAGLLAVGFVMLFSLEPPVELRVWLVISLVLVFSGYSLGTILLYGESETLAGSAAQDAQLRLSTWREAGLLAGVIVAATAPYVLPGGFGGFGWMMAVLATLGCIFTLGLWQPDHVPREPFSPRQFIGAGGGWLLLIALVNSLPVAITSTLFVFFVEDRLGLAGWSGPLLILFFLGAGLSVPVWSALARQYGSRWLLVSGVVLSIASFVWAAFLQQGDGLSFGAICLASGVALGADMVILPAVFASLLGRSGIAPGQGFGLWSFANKLSLPIAAAVVLPALQSSGFVAGETNGSEQIERLVILYAIFPCILKLVAGVVFMALPSRIFDDAKVTR